MTVTKIRLEYSVEYKKANTVEIFELIKDSLNNYKIDAYKLDIVNN